MKHPPAANLPIGMGLWISYSALCCSPACPGAANRLGTRAILTVPHAFLLSWNTANGGMSAPARMAMGPLDCHTACGRHPLKPSRFVPPPHHFCDGGLNWQAKKPAEPPGLPRSLRFAWHPLLPPQNSARSIRFCLSSNSFVPVVKRDAKLLILKSIFSFMAQSRHAFQARRPYAIHLCNPPFESGRNAIERSTQHDSCLGRISQHGHHRGGLGRRQRLQPRSGLRSLAR
jgi:hypothetical protein